MRIFVDGWGTSHICKRIMLQFVQKIVGECALKDTSLLPRSLNTVYPIVSFYVEK